MGTYSFDIVSDYNKAEMNNVFDQVQREISTRYDFKGTPAAIEWLTTTKNGLKIIGASEWQIDAILDIVRKKIAARGQSQNVLDVSHEPVTSNLTTTKDVPFKQGISQAHAKTIAAVIRAQHPKVKANIQADTVRVSSSSKDELQHIMQLLRGTELAALAIPLQCINFR